MIWQEVEQLIYSSRAKDVRLNPRQHITNHHHQRALCSSIGLVHFLT